MTHNACIVRFLARICLKLITRSSLIRLVKLVYLWFSWRYNITQYLVTMPGNSVPGNNRKLFDEISRAHPVFYGIL